MSKLPSCQVLFSETIRHVVPKGWQVHVLSNDDQALAIFSQLYNRGDVAVVDYRLMEPSRRSRDFMDRYVHQSVNGMEYERFCL